MKIKNKFEFFFISPIYLKYKNSLFNYLIRKKRINWMMNCKKYKKKLDIGSGISPILIPNNTTYFMDISKNAIDFLKNKNINASVSDIKKIKSKSNNYNLIICSEVLEHIDDYKKAINELYRILKTKGELIISVPIYKYYWMGDDEYVGHIRRFNPEELLKALNQTGFKILDFKYSGNPLERILTFMTVFLFEKSKLKNKANEHLLNRTFFIYKYINIFLSYFLIFIDLLTPKNLSTIILVKCKK